MTPTHTPDHSIDRLLHALRDATPPTGMERRILNILEAEAQRTTPHSSQTGLLSPLRNLFEGVIPNPLRNLLESVIPSGATKSRSRETPAPRPYRPYPIRKAHRTQVKT